MRFMKLALLGAALAVPATSAFADTFTYSTTGSFSGTDCAAVTSCTNGTANLSFSSQPSTTKNSPTNITLGYFLSQATDGGGTFGGTDKFTLTITQTAPSGGAGTTSSPLSGKISSTDNNITVTFDTTQFVFGNNTYTLGNKTYLLVPPNPNGTPGQTTIQASVVTATPEPSSLALLGTGLLGVAGVVRKKLVRA